MNPENNADSRIAGVKSLRLLRPSIIVLCGPAACGKSTFAERHFRPTQIISSDWARARVCDDERDQRCNAQAFALVHFLIEQRLTVNRLCVVDSTALTPQARKDLLDLGKRFQVPTTLMVFDVPLETCVERDAKRERSVGRAIVERQYLAFEQSKTTIGEEGFDQVVEFSDLENVQIEIQFRPVLRAAERPQRPDEGAPRRIERSTQPFRPRPRGQGDHRRPGSSGPIPPGGRPGSAPRPTTTTGYVSSPRVGAPPPAQPPAPAASPQAPAPPADSAVVSPPGSPAPAAALPQPAAPAAAPPVPASVEKPAEN